MQLFRSHGLRRKKHYWHEVPGLNFRITNMQAALGCAQIECYAKILAERARVYETYLKYLENIKGISLQVFKPEVDKVVWVIAITLDMSFFRLGRDSVLDEMTKAGIELRPGFYSASQIEYFNCPKLKTCDSLAASIVCLPSYPTLTNDEIFYICQKLVNLKRSL
jgi:perosamine synthetase